MPKTFEQFDPVTDVLPDDVYPIEREGVNKMIAAHQLQIESGLLRN
jgi:hypothetical protein